MPLDMVVFYFCINMYDQPSSPAYLPGGGLPVVMMAGDPRGSRLLHWARPWSAVIPGELHSCCLYRIIFYRGGVACGPPNVDQSLPYTVINLVLLGRSLPSFVRYFCTDIWNLLID